MTSPPNKNPRCVRGMTTQSRIDARSDDRHGSQGMGSMMMNPQNVKHCADTSERRYGQYNDMPGGCQRGTRRYNCQPDSPRRDTWLRSLRY
ncbi:hypothetical protein QPK87_34715 [Kamptonema cortianum]|nr:hypothetical protein [Kamptonema cortianum]